MIRGTLPFTLAALLCAAPAFAQDARPPAAPPFHLNAGYANDSFFLRSDDDNFVLIPSGRLQMDFLGYQGSGHANEPYNTFFARRARIELFGTIMKHWDFQVGAEYDGTTVQFPTGTAPPIAPAISTDAYINANYTTYANVQVGQFDAPFTMENRTSDKYTDSQERAVAVRGFAIPENKAVGGMVWGMPEAKWAYWSLGIFDGEGQNQFIHHNSAFDVMGRAWFAPLGLADVSFLKWVWVGASFDQGKRDWPAKSQLQHLSFSDTGKFTFFSPSYKGAPSKDVVQAGDYGNFLKYAIEINAPVGPFVLKGEYIHVNQGLRELDTTAPATPGGPAAVRNATMDGSAWYVRLSYFAFGDPLINGLAGQQLPPHLFGPLKPGKTDAALQLLVEWNHIAFAYTGDKATENAAETALVGAGIDGNYGLDVYTAGANLWLTKRVRLTANFNYNVYSGLSAHPLFAPTSYEVTARAALVL